MRVINLRAKNIKNLTAVEITPSEDAVILRGKNGAGKSAVIDSIFMALTGAKIDRPIREGENKAVIEVDLGEYTVVKTFTPKGSYLKVSSKSGSTFASPQAMLDKLLGKLSFDPLHFISLRPPAQRIILMDLAGLNFDEIDNRRQKLYDERTLVNRQARDLEGELKNTVDSPPDLPNEEVSVVGVAKLVNTLHEKRAIYAAWEKSMGYREADTIFCGEKIKEWQKKLEDVKKQVEEVQKQLSGAVEKQSIAIKAEADLSQQQPINPTDDDIAKGEAGIALAEETNIKIRNAKVYRSQKTALGTFLANAETLTKQIQSCDAEKQGQIIAAKMPIKGLAVDDEQVLYHGLPVSQLSTGEQIRISTSIAMALNPDLRVLCVREGSLLDEEGMQAIQQQAKDNDFQLWIERVSEGGVGIIIEDGSIKA